MGLLDRLREALGSRAAVDATRAADADDLFQLSAASVVMEADLDFEPADVAALAFAAMETTDFRDALRDVEAVLEGDGWAGVHEDDHGYTWAVADRDAFDDLLTDLYVAADTLEDRGYGDRLLAAVFGFEATDGGGRGYWVYSFRRGSFYPFAPAGDQERDTTREVKWQSVLDGDLDVEEDTGYWYPLWPSRPGEHPWD
ncbi:MAG: hypothetical protein ABEJ76_06560 [Halanaeroarchaeum sp.]